MIKFLYKFYNRLDSYAFQSWMFALVMFSRIFLSIYALADDYVDAVVGG
jgi:hypothetical protein